MKRGEIWFAGTPTGGDRPVLVLTRDPLADILDGVVVAQITSTIRGHGSELPLGFADGLRKECVASFDNVLTLRRSDFRRRVGVVNDNREGELCDALDYALGCTR